MKLGVRRTARDSKLKRLEELRREIIEEFFIKGFQGKRIDVWFYPKYDGVMGYLGTQDIAFVGSNPGCSCFPTSCDKIFYAVLKDMGFENAHLTDVLKIRAKGEDVDKYFKDRALLNKNLEYLSREFELIRPKLVVAVGGRAGEILRKKFPRMEIHGIMHYSTSDVLRRMSGIRDTRERWSALKELTLN
ncbi:MAG: hypothetical protein DRN68_01795 [Thaumarchaeota archaeon]|nr:MAG: hypothetical protein DRN68_01795 [Nitrososphaerota archaeon]HDD56872.1 hypothetical protein [Nitrososphaeria archaeon]